MESRLILILLLILTLPTQAATFEELNTAFGIPIWSDENLWDDEPTETAQRLGWPKESNTSTDVSFRSYPEETTRVLGARPYSLALYGEKSEGRPEEKLGVSALSMMFSNKGDAVPYKTGKLDSHEAAARSKAIQEFKATIGTDQAALEKTITDVLGKPTNARFGTGAQTRENVKRWEWNGHAILLAAPKDEYAAVRIIPVEPPPVPGTSFQPKARIPDTVLKARLASNVETLPSGDVLIKNIPMVDQGPKGYCVPATWERVMRYMGIPADMYILAMAANTAAGGGTNAAAIAAGAKEAITRGGRQLAQEQGRPNVTTAKKYISKGIPLIWGVYIAEKEIEFSNRRFERAKTIASGPEGIDLWNKTLAEKRRGANKIKPDHQKGHVRLIVGYNEATKEIAVSDSWGIDGTCVRWITEEEAAAISQPGLQYINL